jgi:hypothetical protein
MSRSSCPLCGGLTLHALMRDDERGYRRCATCCLISVPPEDRPTVAAEEARYRLHENDPADVRYRAFLSRLTDCLLPKLKPGAHGLDFGCGPGPAIAPMLGSLGFRVTNYDPFFCPDETALERAYAFITCTETVEHFHEPSTSFAQLDQLLAAGGWLGVMTELLTETSRFVDWYYARDPTHVSFYCRETMEWIATHWEWQAEFPRKNVVLFHKPQKMP